MVPKIKKPSHFKAQYDAWVWAIVALVILLPLLLTGYYFAIDVPQDALFTLFVSALVAAILWLLLPRRYELWPDRIRIVLGWRMGLNIPFEQIDDVHITRGSSAFVFWGLKFATSVKSPVLIKRKRAMSVIISPREADDFIDAVREARSL